MKTKTLFVLLQLVRLTNPQSVNETAEGYTGMEGLGVFLSSRPVVRCLIVVQSFAFRPVGTVLYVTRQQVIR